MVFNHTDYDENSGMIFEMVNDTNNNDISLGESCQEESLNETCDRSSDLSWNDEKVVVTSSESEADDKEVS